MNILDENIIESQCLLLRSWRIPFRQIGFQVGFHGMKDQQIIPLLLRLPRPTFFTRDADFFDRNLCHEKYCLVNLAVRKDEAAVFIRRLLRFGQFNTVSKRMGAVIQVSHTGLVVWRFHVESPIHYSWIV